ncbi:MAG TPA: aromatic ring-hydroxylating dioxygenase subunit alpha [Terricaulis sp.]|nr:aromatic ring-hydroxylating dioxygenase subunit alpha [Terricaulis sp.]
MILNNWYVATSATDLKPGAPMQVRMLGANFVLFRDTDGNAVCLSDVCCHRGAALSAGKVKENCIACPYHGWEFNLQGQCTYIPALGKDVTPPKRARVDAYPTREKFGWVWVFLGDAPEEERPPFLDDSWFPEYFDEENWRRIPMQYEAPANWARSEENSIDGAHPSFVHSSFGSKRDPKVHIVPIDKPDQWTASTTRERTPPDRSQKTGRMRELTAEVRGKTRATTAFCFTGITHRIVIDRSDGLRQRTLSHRTPIDRYNTRTFTTQVRDYDFTPEADIERLEGRRQAVREDVAIVQTVLPKLPPRRPGQELLTEADQLEGAFRQIIQRRIDAGWEIDSQIVDRDADHEVYVIPSPERRLDPKGWVHRPVPTTKPRDGGE